MSQSPSHRSSIFKGAMAALCSLVVLIGIVIGSCFFSPASTNEQVESGSVSMETPFDGGGAAGTGPSGGMDKSGQICRSRVFYDDYDGSGTPTQGWEGDSVNWFYEQMKAAMGGCELGSAHISSSVYWDTAARALDRARARTSGATKARVIGVCWVYTYNTHGLPICYLAKSWLPDMSKTSAEWMLPSPNEPNGPVASPNGSSTGWTDPAWGQP